MGTSTLGIFQVFQLKSNHIYMIALNHEDIEKLKTKLKLHNAGPHLNRVKQ